MHIISRNQTYSALIFLAFLSWDIYAESWPRDEVDELPCLSNESIELTSKTQFEGHRHQVGYLDPLDDWYEQRHAFSNFSNWIVPGHVMLGRYPYVEPAHCHSKLEGERQMAMLISAGITTFVSLQEELPPQHALRSSGANGFLPYKATAELLWHNVAGHHSRQQVTSISSAGTGHLDIIGNDREEELGIVIERATTIHHQPLPNIIEREMSDELQRGLRFIHAPIVDLGIPSTEDLRSLLVQLTDLILMKREKLYIHCWGGCGRAGMVGTALLVAAYSVPVEEALERVQRGFYTRNGKSHKTCPETAEQFQFLRQFLLDYNSSNTSKLRGYFVADEGHDSTTA